MLFFLACTSKIFMVGQPKVFIVKPTKVNSFERLVVSFFRNGASAFKIAANYLPSGKESNNI